MLTILVIHNILQCDLNACDCSEEQAHGKIKPCSKFPSLFKYLWIYAWIWHTLDLKTTQVQWLANTKYKHLKLCLLCYCHLLFSYDILSSQMQISYFIMNKWYVQICLNVNSTPIFAHCSQFLAKYGGSLHLYMTPNGNRPTRCSVCGWFNHIWTRGDQWAKIVEQRAIKNRVQYIHCR